MLLFKGNLLKTIPAENKQGHPYVQHLVMDEDDGRSDVYMINAKEALTAEEVTAGVNVYFVGVFNNKPTFRVTDDPFAMNPQ